MAVAFNNFYTAVTDILPEEIAEKTSGKLLTGLNSFRGINAEQLEMLASIFRTFPTTAGMKKEIEHLRRDLQHLSTQLEIPFTELLDTAQKRVLKTDLPTKDIAREIVEHSHLTKQWLPDYKETVFVTFDTLSSAQKKTLDDVVQHVVSAKRYIEQEQLKQQVESLQPKELFKQVKELKQQSGESSSSRDSEKPSASSEETQQLRLQLDALTKAHQVLQTQLAARQADPANPPPPPPPPVPGAAIKSKRPTSYTPALEKKRIREIIQECVQGKENEKNREKLKEHLFPPLGKAPDSTHAKKLFEAMLNEWIKQKKPQDLSEEAWHQKIFDSFEQANDNSLVEYDFPNMQKTVISAEDQLAALLAGKKEEAQAALNQELSLALAKRGKKNIEQHGEKQVAVESKAS